MKSKKVIRAFHFDICKPITPLFNRCKIYIITFIDDCSRKIWVYFLQEKSKDFEALNWYKTLVKNEAEKQKKCYSNRPWWRV
jgi:hypothetical protein